MWVSGDDTEDGNDKSTVYSIGQCFEGAAWPGPEAALPGPGAALFLSVV